LKDLQAASARHIADAAPVRFYTEDAQLILVPLSEDGYVDASSLNRQPILNIHIVRPIDAGDLLPKLSIEAENIESAVRRTGFVGSQDEAALGL
jgi:hypothetical protein